MNARSDQPQALPPQPGEIRLRRGALAMPTLLSGLLVATVFMPFCAAGCDGNLIYPCELYQTTTLEDFAGAQALVWPFTLGGILLISGCGLLLAARPRHLRWAWTALAVPVTVASLAIFVYLGIEMRKWMGDRPIDLEELTWALILFVLASIGLATVVLSRLMARDWLQALMSLQLVLVIAAAAQIAFFAQAFFFDDKLRLGGYLSAISSVLLVPATILEWRWLRRGLRQASVLRSVAIGRLPSPAPIILPPAAAPIHS